MNRNRSIMQRIIQGNQLSNHSLTPVPLIEITGCNRLLIEHHICVISYSVREISIQVKYGRVLIQGDNLHLMYMSSEKLVITGKLLSIHLCTGNGL